MNPLTCPSVEELAGFLKGRLPEDQANAAAEHLQQCPHCLEKAQQLDRSEDLRLSPPATAPWAAEREVVEELVGQLKALYPAAREGILAQGEQMIRNLSAWAAALPAAERTKAEELLEVPQELGETGRIGPYRIVRVLGSGGMGIVFEARQEQPRRTVALKMILAGRRPGPERLARFRAETEVVARLQHPGIVQVHAVGEHEGVPFFTMEYVEGGSLAQRLAAAPLPPLPAAALVEALAGAVHFAHEHGVVHRDLKPSNVLLAPAPSAGDGTPGPPGTPKISDFGLAKSLEEGPDPEAAWQTASGAILGTPSYMAPEQAAGSQAVGPAADLYALGAILYECLTGRPPFRSATLLETLEQVRSQEPVAPRSLRPGLPRDLETICLKCLHKEPARRYASAQALADDLGRFLRGEAIAARPVSGLERLGKWARRQPALASLLAFSGLLLIALVVSGLVYNAHLRRAVARAEAKEEEARQQRELAAGHYRAARDTLGQMLHRLELLPAGEMRTREEMQRDVLEDALSFYQAVRGADDPDPRVRLDTARAYERAGIIEGRMGQNRQGKARIRQSIALLETLPDEMRQTSDCRILLADAYTYLGTQAIDLQQPDEAERCQRQAVALREQLVREQPEDSEWQRSLALSETLLAATLRNKPTSRAEAETFFNRAINRYAALIKAHPDLENYQVLQAGVYTELGYLYRLMQRASRAEAAYAKAEGLLAPLAAAHPKDLSCKRTLAALYITWSDFLLSSKRPRWGGLLPGPWDPARAALKRADQAVDLIEQVLLRQRSLAGVRELGREAHVKRAAACEALGRWQEAVKSWDRASALEASNSYLRVRRVRALACMGEHRRASAEAQDLAKENATSTARLWELAQVQACCFQAVHADTYLSRNERRTLVDHYTAEAVALLRQLQARGYFQPQGRKYQLAADRDLQLMRDQATFRTFLASVK